MINPDQDVKDYLISTRFFGDEREFVSTYYQHSSELAEGSNAFSLWAEMPQVQPAILPGATANLDVDLVAAGLRVIQGYQLPMTALDVGSKEKEFFVWKLKGNKVHRQPVDIMKINSDGVIVTQGVNDGDKLVNSNLRKMREGAVVELVKKESKQ